MKIYSDTIQLTTNSRGVLTIDPILGCSSGTKLSKNGCYGDCYAAKSAKRYGFDFTKTVKRRFKSVSHLELTKRKLFKSVFPFVRMGTMGDPSEDWPHTLNICSLLRQQIQLSLFGHDTKEIVIITKHWNNLTDSELNKLRELKVCINTSLSVLDDDSVFNNSILQYERLKPYCRSILRVVTCNFNTCNPIGLNYHNRQKKLLENHKILDTVFRVSKNNKLVTDGVINIHKTKFLGQKCYVSKLNKKTYFGKCGTCIEKCGIGKY